MKTKKCIATLASLALIAGLISGSHVEVNADDTATPSTVKGSVVTLSSYLIMRKGAVVPSETFNYTVSYLDTSSTITKPVDGTPGTGVATFDSQIKPSTTPGSAMTRTTDANYVSHDTASDVITLNDDDLYARKDFTLDFSGVTFNDVGTYNYLITETAGENAAITYASPLILQVIVQYTDSNSKTLAAPVYVLYTAKKTETSYTIATDTNGNSSKQTGFANRYETFNLDVYHIVKGNQASHDEYFPVTVKLSEAAVNATYNVDLSGTGTNTGETPTNAATAATHTNPTTITIGDDGTGTAVFWVKNLEKVTIQGLPKNVNYSVQQDMTKLNSEGYTPKAYNSALSSTGIVLLGTYSTTSSVLNQEQTLTLQENGVATYGTRDTDLNTVYEKDGRWTQDGNNIKITVSSTTTITYTLSQDGKTLTYVSYDETTADATTQKDMSRYKYMQNYSSTDAIIKGASVDFSEGSYSTQALAITADTTILLENTNSGVIPTGVILSVAPYAAVLLAGLFGLIIFMMKRRNQEEAE